MNDMHLPQRKICIHSKLIVEIKITIHFLPTIPDIDNYMSSKCDSIDIHHLCMFISEKKTYNPENPNAYP
jgi:transcriptional regulatory protein LevR